MRRAVPVSLALAGVVFLAGCGSTTPDTPGATSASATPTSPDSTTSTSTSTGTSTSTSPTAPPSDKVTTTTLTGTVTRAAVEGSCLVLVSGDRTYLLVGAVTGLTAGQEVVVTGHVDPTVATTCQNGTPFMVESVEPGGASTG